MIFLEKKISQKPAQLTTHANLSHLLHHQSENDAFCLTCHLIRRNMFLNFFEILHIDVHIFFNQKI